MRGGRFAFSYKERNKREVSFKSVKIDDDKASTRFVYQKAQYDVSFIFDGNELILLKTQYEHEDYG